MFKRVPCLSGERKSNASTYLPITGTLRWPTGQNYAQASRWL
ncbi:hypothetical protein [Edaphovirga cremea]|nr:hypothetical protein [Edaphovirga cremea]